MFGFYSYSFWVCLEPELNIKKLQTWNSWFLHYSLLQHIICSGLSFQVAHTFAYLIALINPDFQQEKKKKTKHRMHTEGAVFLDGIFKNRRDDILSYSIVKKMTPPMFNLILSSVWFINNRQQLIMSFRQCNQDARWEGCKDKHTNTHRLVGAIHLQKLSKKQKTDNPVIITSTYLQPNSTSLSFGV